MVLIIFFFFFIFSKNNPKNKQMSIGKKKFNMDPKKVYTDRKKLWNENEMTLLHAGFPTKFLSQTPPPLPLFPFHFNNHSQLVSFECLITETICQTLFTFTVYVETCQNYDSLSESL